MMELSDYHRLSSHLDHLDMVLDTQDLMNFDYPESDNVFQSVLDKSMDVDLEINNNIVVPDRLDLDMLVSEPINPSQEPTAAPAETPKQETTVPSPEPLSEPDTSQEASIPLRRSSRQSYNLRTSSIINRLETDKRRATPKKPKPKKKPPALSKYRRKTANSRERDRMKEINDGFIELQNVIPDFPTNCNKLTKITTLRLAMNYISALREMLQKGDETRSDELPSVSAFFDDSWSPGESSGSPETLYPSVSPTLSDSDAIASCSPAQKKTTMDSEGESGYSS